ncbi:MAG: hypothetical protein KU37_05750 [Sulfuricurvum sp. PC08-66]|nr:MAG: hypothetical protein KU37_05750 [Sulfuricurvum sp. PC08-66]
MKKFLSVVTTAAMLATSAHAISEGAIADVSLGLSTPIMVPSMKVGTSSTSYVDIATDLGLGASIQFDMWGEFTHLIPIIPNVRIEMATLSYTTTQTITVLGQALSGTSTFSMDNKDAILFWGVPFVTLIPFVDKVDFGLGLKMIDGRVGAQAYTESTSTAITAPIPYAWLRGAVSIPVVGVGLAIDSKFIGTDAVFGTDGFMGNKINFSEMVYKATWGIALPIPVLTLEAGAEIGYKQTTLDVTIPNSLYLNGSFSGVIFGVYGVFGI